jgi:hypothetical protein
MSRAPESLRKFESLRGGETLDAGRIFIAQSKPLDSDGPYREVWHLLKGPRAGWKSFDGGDHWEPSLGLAWLAAGLPEPGARA